MKGSRVNYEVSRFPSSLTTPNSLTTPQAASHASGCPIIITFSASTIQGDQRSNFGLNDSREPKTQGLKSFKDRGLPPTISASVIQRDQRSNFGLNDSRASEFQGIEGKGTKDAKTQSLRG